VRVDGTDNNTSDFSGKLWRGEDTPQKEMPLRRWEADDLNPDRSMPQGSAFKDAQFGIFARHPLVKCFEATTSWRGKQVRLTLNLDEVEEALVVARSL
jgi:hypothetical protein